MLLRKLILAAFLLALASAAVAVWAVERVRAADQRLTIERFALGYQTDLIRARCEANPKWFLAGPRENAPSAELMADPDADVLAPRPDADPRPVEWFAFDTELVGQSTAAPRLTPEVRNRLRRTEQLVTEPFTTDAGTGVQTVLTTHWSGPCAYLLFRIHPQPHQWRQRVLMFAGFTTGAFIVAMLVAWPVDLRIRRIGAQMRESARTEYREPASVRGKDELSQLGFAFNEAAVDINRLHTDFKDRDVDYRRFLSYLSADSEALMQSTITSPDPIRAVTDALRMSNIVVGSRLREAAATASAPTDVSGIVRDVVNEFRALAAAKRVRLNDDNVAAGVTATGDGSILRQALRNLLAQAVDREPAGGTVTVVLKPTANGQFVLTVTDTGPTLPDDDLRKLNAVRRFRGDEGRGAQLRGDIGLGLAIVHEVSHRFQLQLTFNRPVTGGLEVRLQSARE